MEAATMRQRIKQTRTVPNTDTKLSLTKIDIAESHLISAVRLHFQQCPIASVYLLAASAQEILTTLGLKTGVDVPTFCRQTDGQALEGFDRCGERECKLSETC